MKRTLHCLGLNHHTAAVALRECISLSVARQEAMLAAAVHHPVIAELAILSTCNRLELYAVLPSPDAAVLVAFLAENGGPGGAGISPGHFQSHLYSYTDKQAAAHLCSVAAGLDSMVLGEAQILGQVSHCFERAVAAQTAGRTLTDLFRVAIRAGKRAHTETAIGRHSQSISAVAVQLAERITGDIAHQHVAVVGAGEMAQLAVKALLARGVQALTLINRTPARAALLAPTGRATVCGLSGLPQALAQADVLILATGAQQPLVTAAQVEAALRQRGGRTLVMVDVGLPRNVDPAVGALAGVQLYNVDQLKAQVDAGKAERQAQIPRVQRIVQQEVEEYMRCRKQLAVRPVIVEWRQQAETIRQQELARALRYLPTVDAQTEAELNHLTRALVNKLLHEPTQRLRDKAEMGTAESYAEAIRYLFALDEP